MANVPQVEAYGLVLDPAALVTDMGRMESTQAAWHAAQADVVRVAGLYRDNLNASLKSLQLAQAQESETGAQARAAAAAFALQWGPVAALGAQKRHALIDALSANRQLLVRAGLPGQHLADSVGPRALLDIDYRRLPAPYNYLLSIPQAHVLAELLDACGRYDGFTYLPGYRLSQLLREGEGRVCGARAEGRAYVYRDARRDPGGRHQYEAAAVQLLAAVGDSWLVSGLNASDAIVVQGAGVLWSLQGIGSFSPAEEEHD